MGYIGYDILSQYKNILFKNEDDIEMPEVHLLLTKEVFIYDHFRQQIILVVNADPSDAEAYETSLKRLEEMEREIRENLPFVEEDSEDSYFEMKSNVTKSEFIKGVVKAKEYISRGEIEQVVLSQRFQAKNFAKTTL